MTALIGVARNLITAIINDGAAREGVRGLHRDDIPDDDLGELYDLAMVQPPCTGPIPISLLTSSIKNKGKRRRLDTLAAELSLGEVIPAMVPHLAGLLIEGAHYQRIGLAAEALAKNPGDLTLQARTAALIDSTVRSSNRPSLFLSAEAFLYDDASIDYLIPGMVERDTTGQLFGPSGGGKTFLALHLSLAVAIGGEVHGRRANRGLVLYLAGEGHRGLRRRVKAFQEHHGMEPGALGLFYISRQTIPFDGSGLRAVKAEARALAEACGAPIALIVVDTLARHLEGDENATADMNRFIAAIDDLRGTFPGAVAMVVHHTGHGEETRTRARGSSALKAAMDFEICCDRGLLTFTKMKDSEPPEPIPFKLRPVQIGTNPDGEPLTSCVVEFGERAESQVQAELTSMEKLAIKALAEAASRAVDCPPGEVAALVGDWREAFYSLRREQAPDAKTDTMKKAFLRCEESLADKKMITVAGHLRSLKKQPGQGTLAGHSVTCPGGIEAGHRDTPFIRVSRVPVPCPPDDDPCFFEDPEEQTEVWGQA